ncbi:hypothetical protein [Brevibacterium album]|uniref:hypothetical protein n=1 Tax=Brevibacterium album TaxID=417948 RepID=UPI00048FC71A|nr:hypothetical protein [Brevibacterium album]
MNTVLLDLVGWTVLAVFSFAVLAGSLRALLGVLAAGSGAAGRAAGGGSGGQRGRASAERHAHMDESGAVPLPTRPAVPVQAVPAHGSVPAQEAGLAHDTERAVQPRPRAPLGPGAQSRARLGKLIPQFLLPEQLVSAVLAVMLWLVLARFLSVAVPVPWLLTLVWWVSAAITVAAIACSGGAWVRLTQLRTAMLEAEESAATPPGSHAVRYRIRSARTSIRWEIGLLVLGVGIAVIRRWSDWP